MKTKRSHFLAVLALGTVGFLALAASDESERANPSDEPKELGKLVTRLESKIGDLEKRLKSVESRTNWTFQPHVQVRPGVPQPYQPPVITVPPTMPRSGPPKTGWSPVPPRFQIGSKRSLSC
ncbi:MAG: hypothetical protein HY735_02100 [Verrucomicrobia bacterium]|nr:hypothetical protein [Verrucomicrobiota bacterium]